MIQDKSVPACALQSGKIDSIVVADIKSPEANDIVNTSDNGLYIME